MTNNRRRGRLGETEFVQRYGGERVSRTGEAGPDVLDARGQLVEVKRLRTLPALIRGWLLQTHREGASYVAFRADRDKWYIILDCDNFFNSYTLNIPRVNSVITEIKE